MTKKNQKELEPKDYKPKVKLIKWNGEINFGNILTIIAILIAFGGLYLQKKSVDTKVEDLESLVNRLEQEIYNRKIQGLDIGTEINNSFSYTHGYTIDQLRIIQRIYDYEFFMTLNEVDELIDIVIKNNQVNKSEKDRLELLKERNEYKKQAIAIGQNYFENMIKFENEFEPKKENYESTEEFIKAQRIYNDTLTKFTQYALDILSASIEKPNQELNRLEQKYLQKLKSK